MNISASVIDRLISMAWNDALEQAGFRLWTPEDDERLQRGGISHANLVREFSRALDRGATAAINADEALALLVTDFIDVPHTINAPAVRLVGSLWILIGHVRYGKTGWQNYAYEAIHECERREDAAPSMHMAIYAVSATLAQAESAGELRLPLMGLAMLSGMRFAKS